MFGKIVKIAVIIMGLGWIASRVWGSEEFKLPYQAHGDLNTYEPERRQFHELRDEYIKSFPKWVEDTDTILRLDPANGGIEKIKWDAWTSFYYDLHIFYPSEYNYQPSIGLAIQRLKELKSAYEEKIQTLEGIICPLTIF
jgi:hypothetical protein